MSQSIVIGLTSAQVAERLKKFGPNVLPKKRTLGFFAVFIRQFLSPLIYVLIACAVVSVVMSDYVDAGFIAAILIINAVLGAVQEYGAERSAEALKQMVAQKAMVLRDGLVQEIDGDQLVVDDVVYLESGRKVPADLRLLNSNGLHIDESLLTGESLPSLKDHTSKLDRTLALGDQRAMAFSGSLVTQGRGQGVVIATGLQTELGKISRSLATEVSAPPPLLQRMTVFTSRVAYWLLFASCAMGAVLFWRGESWFNVLIFSVAVAVSAIPEGLPVALTVALSVASRRMAKRNVLVRRLPAVEALGSCTFIATDKTGTLTINRLTIEKIVAGNTENILRAGCLCNEAVDGTGDAVDLAFWEKAKDVGISNSILAKQYILKDSFPFEPQNQYAATRHEVVGAHENVVTVKGALERLLPMCSTMQSSHGVVPLDVGYVQQQAESLAAAGYRVLALAQGNSSVAGLSHTAFELPPSGLTFLGLVGMIDPLRTEARDAVQACRRAGITVAMVTGDHPVTALAIARQLDMADSMDQVVSGPQLAGSDATEAAHLMNNALVFARVTPTQKLQIVQHFIAQGKFVAVTGDGANDAPALNAANVGIAMGHSGTDVAKEASDLILLDDRFASIVAGIEEGRIAYANIRKVIYLLISTGAAEILIFLLSLISKTPLPLTAAQILWLNLVTNGIQDVALAVEPGEGDELTRPPRPSNEPIFNRSMIERIVLSAVVMGGVSFGHFWYSLQEGSSLEVARNSTLLLMVLFENIMIGNCRSETKSAFTIKPWSNPALLIGAALAQGVHILAMYLPGLSSILSVSPVPVREWLELLALAASVFVVMELYRGLRVLMQKTLGN